MLQGYLLDLPELVLEKISKHLSLRDLASCMMTCTTLRVLLRPRLNAMISARHFGRKWVLRACGCALFADVTRRVAAGVANFEGPELIPKWDAWTAALRGVTGHGPELFKEWIRLKATCPAPLSTDMVDLNLYFYLCRLAESRGFGFTARILERVWERTVATVPVVGFPRNQWSTVFEALRVAEASDLGFQPFGDFAGSQFFPGPLDLSFVLGPVEKTEVEVHLFRVSVDLLNSEMMCLLWLLFILTCINTPDFDLLQKTITERLPLGFGPFFAFLLNDKKRSFFQ